VVEPAYAKCTWIAIDADGITCYCRKCDNNWPCHLSILYSLSLILGFLM